MNPPLLNVTMSAPRRARLEIYSEFGPSWAGMVDAKSVAKAISAVGELDVIELHINSRGGSAWEGLAIASILRDHPARVEAVVDGIAASAATLPLMAADYVRIPKNALLMIHDPALIVFGGERELNAALAQIAAVKKAAVSLYAEKSGKTADEVSELMTAETWYTGEEAVAAGFADATEPELPKEKAPVKAALKLEFNVNGDTLKGLTATPVVEVQAALEGLMPDSIVTPAAPASAAPAVAAVVNAITQADLEQAKNEALAEGQRTATAVAAEICTLCLLAGKPEKAGDYVASGKSLADVRQELKAAVCKDRAPTADGEPTVTTPDENTPYKAEYAKQKDAYLKAGVTEAEYVQSRRIDDGKDALTTKPAA